MFSALSGKGLFVFSDPGGAKPVLALAESLEDKLSAYKIISDREYGFADDFAVTVNKQSLSAGDELKKERPDFLFTGTSYTSSVELDFIKAAKAMSVPSFAFVDHWTSIKERFIRNGETIFPDKILVIDDRALKIAVGQGIDKEMVSVVGNPYHQYLKGWKPAMTKEIFLKGIVPASNKRTIIYAPDPLSNVDGKSKFGFDEINATKEICLTAERLKDQFNFLFIAHPNQKQELIKPLLGEKMILLPADTNVNAALYYADIVIGFFSNILIEASIMQKTVIRFLPKGAINDPFAEMNIGKTVNEDTITETLTHLK